MQFNLKRALIFIFIVWISSSFIFNKQMPTESFRSVINKSQEAANSSKEYINKIIFSLSDTPPPTPIPGWDN